MSSHSVEDLSANERLHDAIHDLSQPLTTLMFVLEMGKLQTKPEAWRGSLETAVQECKRAIAALDDVRSAAEICAPQPEVGEMR